MKIRWPRLTFPPINLWNMPHQPALEDTMTMDNDQFTPDPSSREAAIDAMVMEVQPHEWRQGGTMRYQGHLITWGEYIQRRRAMSEAWHQAQDDLADAWDEQRAAKLKEMNDGNT